MAYKEEKMTVFADADWYKKDHQKTEEWNGILQKADPVKLPPHSGTGPVVTTFYQLGVIVAPPLPLREMTIYSHAEHSHVLNKYIGQQVKIIGKLKDDQIWPGYLIPVTNPGGPAVPAGGSANPGGPIIPEGRKLTVFGNDEAYKKDHDKVEEWTGRLQQYEQFHIPPGHGVGPVVTLFYKLEIRTAAELPIQEKIIYSENSKNKVLDQHLNQEVRIIGKLHQDQIWPGYMVVLTNPGGPNIPADPSTVEPIILLFGDTEWYRKDHDKIQEWSGKLEKYDHKLPPHSGTGPVQTLFYQLEIVLQKQQHPHQIKVVYTHAEHNNVLDSHIGTQVKLIGKLHDDQIWPGYLVPLYTINQ